MSSEPVLITSPWTPSPAYKKAAIKVVPDAVTVMGPFHVVALIGTNLDETRSRLQAELHGRRGRSGDDFYGIRNTIRTRVGLLSEKQKHQSQPGNAANNNADIGGVLAVLPRHDQGLCRRFEEGQEGLMQGLMSGTVHCHFPVVMSSPMCDTDLYYR